MYSSSPSRCAAAQTCLQNKPGRNRRITRAGNASLPPTPCSLADAYGTISLLVSVYSQGLAGGTGGDRAAPPPIFSLMVSFGLPSAGGGDIAVGGGTVDGFFGGFRRVLGGAVPPLSSRLMVTVEAVGHWSLGIGLVLILLVQENFSLPFIQNVSNYPVAGSRCTYTAEVFNLPVARVFEYDRH